MISDLFDPRFASNANMLLASWRGECACPDCGAPGVRFRNYHQIVRSGNYFESLDWKAGPTHAEFICGARIELPTERRLVPCNPRSRGSEAWRHGRKIYKAMRVERAVELRRSKPAKPSKPDRKPGDPVSHVYPEELDLPGAPGWKCRQIAFSEDVRSLAGAAFGIVALEQLLMQDLNPHCQTIGAELERLRFRTRGITTVIRPSDPDKMLSIPGVAGKSRALLDHESLGVIAPGVGNPISSRWGAEPRRIPQRPFYLSYAARAVCSRAA